MNNIDDIFTIIGKLYVDIYNSQKIIELLQQQLKEKEEELSRLRKPQDSDE